MKCKYMNRVCNSSEKDCFDCLTDEIKYLRKKISNMESKNNVKEGSITITQKELVNAQANAMTLLTIKNPSVFLISDVLTEASALTCKILFEKKEEK